MVCCIVTLTSGAAGRLLNLLPDPAKPMQRVAVINVVGLTQALLGPHTPRILAFSQRGACAKIVPTLPAVTCTAQATYLTGLAPSAHGIVGNGWYHRDLAEVQFWKQSNHLVQAPKLWDELRAQFPGFTCACLFWWFNMYSTADYSITPRPIYPADGRKVFDIYSWPYSIRPAIKKDLGEFPFPAFWGPAAGMPSPAGPPDAASRWIADSARWIENTFGPNLSLIYLPHLDYNLQRHGVFDETGQNLNPAILGDLRAIDNIVGGLLDFFDSRPVRVVLLSEYGIASVNCAVHLNRLSPTFTWTILRLKTVSAGSSNPPRAWRRCSGAPKKPKPALTTNAPATWLPSPNRTHGSPIIIGSTPPPRRTSRAPWIFIANRVTIPSSCFWIRVFDFQS